MTLGDFITKIIISVGLSLIIGLIWIGYWIFYQDKKSQRTNRIFYWVLFIFSFLGSFALYYLSLCMCEPPLVLENLLDLLLFLVLPVLSLALAVKNFIFEIKSESLLGKLIRMILIIVMSYFIVKIINVAIYSYRFEL